MEANLTIYKNFSKFLKLMLIISGLWPEYHSIINKIMGFFGIMATLITSLSILNFLINHIKNVLVAASCAALFLAFFTSTVKSAAFMWYSNDLEYLNSFLSMKFENDLKEIKYRALALTYVQFITRLSQVIMGGVFLSCTFNGIKGFSRMLAYKFMFPTALPFNYEPGGIVYWTISVIELAAHYFIQTITCGVDSSFGLYTIQICGELKILAHRFANLENSKNYRKDLKDCIERHCLLIQCQNKLEKIYGLMVIWIVVSTAVIVCTLIFQIIRATLTSFKFGFICGYIVVKLMQAFVYAFCGQLIAEESSTCLNSIYKATWPGCGDKKFMNDVLFVLSQKPLEFSAKGFMILKMDVFSKIVNTSVSYFFLLQTLDEDAQ